MMGSLFKRVGAGLAVTILVTLGVSSAAGSAPGPGENVDSSASNCEALISQFTGLPEEETAIQTEVNGRFLPTTQSVFGGAGSVSYGWQDFRIDVSQGGDLNVTHLWASGGEGRSYSFTFDADQCVEEPPALIPVTATDPVVTTSDVCGVPDRAAPPSITGVAYLFNGVLVTVPVEGSAQGVFTATETDDEVYELTNDGYRFPAQGDLVLNDGSEDCEPNPCPVFVDQTVNQAARNGEECPEPPECPEPGGKNGVPPLCPEPPECPEVSQVGEFAGRVGQVRPGYPECPPVCPERNGSSEPECPEPPEECPPGTVGVPPNCTEEPPVEEPGLASECLDGDWVLNAYGEDQPVTLIRDNGEQDDVVKVGETYVVPDDVDVVRIPDGYANRPKGCESTDPPTTTNPPPPNGSTPPTSTPPSTNSDTPLARTGGTALGLVPWALGLLAVGAFTVLARRRSLAPVTVKVD